MSKTTTPSVQLDSSAPVPQTGALAPALLAGSSDAHKAAVASWYALSDAQRSQLIDELGLNEAYQRQIKAHFKDVNLDESLRVYGILPRVAGAVIGLGSSIATFLAVRNKINWGWATKAFATAGAGIVGIVAGLSLATWSLFSMRQVALGHASERSFERGNDEFVKLVTERMREQKQSFPKPTGEHHFATIERASPSQSIVDKYATPPAANHVVAEELAKDESEPRFR